MKLSVNTPFLLVLWVGLLMSSSAVWAQTGTTSVHGTVFDKSHAVVAGATVTVTNAGQALQRQTVTAASGECEFVALPPRNYSLTVERLGFGRYHQTGLELLERFKTAHPDCEVLMLSGQGTIQTAVQAMKLGAFDYLLKPLHEQVARTFRER